MEYAMKKHSTPNIPALIIPALCTLIISGCSNSLQNTGPSDTLLTNEALMPEPNAPVQINLTPGTLSVSTWESLGGCTRTTPVGIWTDEANFMVAAKGCDGKLWTKRWNNDLWSNWTTHNTCLNSSPNITVHPNSKQLVMSYVDCQGTIQLQSSNDAGETWQTKASRRFANTSDAVTTVWETPTQLNVYFVTNTGEIQYVNADTLANGTPNILSGTTPDPKNPAKKKGKPSNACGQGAIAATSNMAGRTDIVYLGCKNTVSVATATNGAWEFFLPDVPANKKADPAAKHIDAVWNTTFPPTLEVFFQGPKKKLYQTTLANGLWSDPSTDPDPTPITGGIATTNLNIAGEMTMLTNASDGQVYIKFLIHTNPSAGITQ
jgi:hypothetical protein